MSEADNPEKKPEVQNSPASAAKPTGNDPDAKDGTSEKNPPPVESPAVAPAEPEQPAEQKPKIQLGSEQFAGSSPADKETKPVEKVSENSGEQVESGPHKILHELEKDIPPLTEEVVVLASGETSLSVPGEIDVPAAKSKSESFPREDITAPSNSAEELISYAMRRLDAVLRKIKEAHSES